MLFNISFEDQGVHDPIILEVEAPDWDEAEQLADAHLLVLVRTECLDPKLAYVGTIGVA